MVHCLFPVIYFLLQLIHVDTEETEIIGMVFDPAVTLPGQSLCITLQYTITPGYYLRSLYFQAEEIKWYYTNICQFSKENSADSTKSYCFQGTQWSSRVYIPDSEISNKVCFSEVHPSDNFYEFRWYLTVYNNNDKFDRRNTQKSFDLDIKTAENMETKILNCNILNIKLKKMLSKIEKLYIYRLKTKQKKELIYLWRIEDKENIQASFPNQSIIDKLLSNSSHIKLISHKDNAEYIIDITAEGKHYSEPVLRKLSYTHACYFIDDVQETKSNTKEILLKLAGTAIIVLVLIILFIGCFVCTNIKEKCRKSLDCSTSDQPDNSLQLPINSRTQNKEMQSTTNDEPQILAPLIKNRSQIFKLVPRKASLENEKVTRLMDDTEISNKVHFPTMRRHFTRSQSASC